MILSTLKALSDIIEGSSDIVFFGGAGVSTESGIPDFRSTDGLYNKMDVRFEGYSAEYLLSHTCLVREPSVFFEFTRQKLDTRNVRPNAAHYYLADLEKRGKLRAVVTQNIDGLHQKAGSRNVLEIHGSTLRCYCSSCHKVYPPSYIFDSTDIPYCTCGGVVRPDVTLYEESLPEEAVSRAISAIRSCEVLIVGGTSLSVYPAASFVDFYRGDRLVVINREHVKDCDLEIIGDIGKVLGALR